jgi:hypothetical protein
LRAFAALVVDDLGVDDLCVVDACVVDLCVVGVVPFVFLVLAWLVAGFDAGFDAASFD